MKKLLATTIGFLLVTVGCIKNVEPIGDPIPQYLGGTDFQDWKSKVSTLNIWDLALISKNQKERRVFIGESLKNRNLDIAVLQEAWAEDSQETIFKISEFPHSVTYTAARTIGAGLMGLSRTETYNPSFREFILNGSLIAPDAWAGKGVGIFTTNIDGLPVSVLTTHIFAGFGRTDAKEDLYTPVRMMQLFEVFAHLIEQTESDAFIVAGDLNTHVGHTEYDFWRSLTSLPGTLYQTEDNGVCTYCGENPFTLKNNGQIDFIFSSPRLGFIDDRIDYTDRFEASNGKMIPASDHYGITSTLYKARSSNDTPSIAKARCREALSFLKSKLNHSKNFPFKAKSELSPLGVEDRLCVPCQFRKAIKMVEEYEIAISEGELPKENPRLQILRTRLNSYFDLFQ